MSSRALKGARLFLRYQMPEIQRSCALELREALEELAADRRHVEGDYPGHNRGASEAHQQDTQVAVSVFCVPEDPTPARDAQATTP
jgi:hypothetical protein